MTPNSDSAVLVCCDGEENWRGRRRATARARFGTGAQSGQHRRQQGTFRVPGASNRKAAGAKSGQTSVTEKIAGCL